MIPRHFQPIVLSRAPKPFSHPDWIFELKWDGFRSLVHVQDGKCRLVSRNGNEFKSFPALNESIPTELCVQSAVLDGEIVCLDETGKPQFRDLLFRRAEPRFCAFDLIWCDGEDLRYMPLIERKFCLRSVVPSNASRMFYCDHVERDGEQLFQAACAHDLEGIVAKRKFEPYLAEHATWQKIRNTGYSQWEGREEFFERERKADPDASLWDSCVEALATLASNKDHRFA